MIIGYLLLIVGCLASINPQSEAMPTDTNITEIRRDIPASIPETIPDNNVIWIPTEETCGQRDIMSDEVYQNTDEEVIWIPAEETCGQREIMNDEVYQNTN